MSKSRLEPSHSVSSEENMGFRDSPETEYFGGCFSGGPINIRIFCKSGCTQLFVVFGEGNDSTTVEHLK